MEGKRMEGEKMDGGREKGKGREKKGFSSVVPNLGRREMGGR